MSTSDRLGRLGLGHVSEGAALRRIIEKIGAAVHERQEQFKMFLLERDALIESEPSKAPLYRQEAARIWKEHVESLRESERGKLENCEFEEDRPLSHRGPNLLHALSLIGISNLRRLNLAEEILSDTITQQILPMISRGACESVIVEQASTFLEERLEGLQTSMGEILEGTSCDVDDAYRGICESFSRCRGIGYQLLIARRVVMLRLLGFTKGRETGLMIQEIKTRDHSDIANYYPPKRLEELAGELIFEQS
jgi:hypothetical protein